MKKNVIVLASVFMMLFAFTIVPATAANVGFAVEISKDCDKCGKEGCTGCEAKKEGEAKKECKEGEKKSACCAHGAKAEKKTEEKKTEEKKK